MAVDRHPGRATPVFVVEGRVDTFIGLIQRHGYVSRILRARRCPCAVAGSPDLYCGVCRGDGFVYDYQRKLLQVDEDSSVSRDGSIVYPFRVPMLEPIRVERLLAPEQGGNVEYAVDSYTAEEIRISGDPLPMPYEKMRVSYYFDRFEHVVDEVVDVDVATKTLTVKSVKFDDGYRSSNAFGATGDLVIVERVYDNSTSHEFSDYTFQKDQIYLGETEPAPTPGEVVVTYYYVPVTKVIPADILSRREKGEKFTTELPQGECRIAFEPWFEIAEGDLITFLISTSFKNEVLSHVTDRDKLFEFDVASVDDEIIDEDGVRYRKGVDFVLRNLHDLVWLGTGTQPAAGKKISVRYGYHPTYVCFIDQSQPNNAENKQFPNIINARLWGKTLAKPNESLPAQNYNWGYAP